jgi:ParB family chromosome partitioning protein
LTVRQTEALVRRLQQQAAHPAAAKAEPDPNIRRLSDRLSEKVGVPVSIDHGDKGAGRLVFKYSSLDELDGILAHLGYSED